MKGNFTLSCQRTVGYNYCFIDVLIKWPGTVHNARMFRNSALNGMFRDGTIPKNHCQGGACSTGMHLWGSTLSFTTIFDEGIFERGKEF